MQHCLRTYCNTVLFVSIKRANDDNLAHGSSIRAGFSIIAVVRTELCPTQRYRPQTVLWSCRAPSKVPVVIFKQNKVIRSNIVFSLIIDSCDASMLFINLIDRDDLFILPNIVSYFIYGILVILFGL